MFLSTNTTTNNIIITTSTTIQSAISKLFAVLRDNNLNSYKIMSVKFITEIKENL